MNRADKVRIYNQFISWTFVLFNYTRIEFSTCEDLYLFLKREIMYWKKHETDFPEGTPCYSKWYERCCAALDGTIEQLTEEEPSMSSLTKLIRAQFNNFEITDIELPYNYSSNGSVQVKNLELTSSSNSDPAAVAYAYGSFYHIDKPLYNAFLDIVERQSLSESLTTRSSLEQQKAAICYIGFQIKAYKYPSRNLLNKEKVESLENEVANVAQNLVVQRTDINEFLDNCRKEYDAQYADRNKEIDDFREVINTWYEESNTKVNSLEDTYREKLHLSAPVMHWESEAEKKRKSFNRWLIITSVMCIALMCIATLLIYLIFSRADVVINLTEGSPLYFIPQYFVFVATVTFLVYIIRVFIKITMSEKHMQVEYTQKAALTYFYLSLLQNSNSGISKEERSVIISTLFSKADTGLIKSDGKAEKDANLFAALLTK